MRVIASRFVMTEWQTHLVLWFWSVVVLDRCRRAARFPSTAMAATLSRPRTVTLRVWVWARRPKYASRTCCAMSSEHPHRQRFASRLRGRTILPWRRTILIASLRMIPPLRPTSLLPTIVIRRRTSSPSLVLIRAMALARSAIHRRRFRCLSRQVAR